MSIAADLIEKSPLWKLKDSLSDAQLSTKKMLSKLEKFERRLGNLDSKISRIQTTTENYSRARENITLVLSEVQKTNEYFRVAKEVEPAMKAKFANSKAFFIGIERLTNAKIFFNAHEKGIKASGQALKTIDSLLKKGVAACCEELEKLLFCKKSVEITDEQNKEGLCQISPSAIKDIKAICDCLEANNYTEHYAVYERVRISQVVADLKEHNIATAAAWDDLTQDIPYQRGSHPLKSFASLVHSLLRNEMHLWTAIYTVRNEHCLEAYVSVCYSIIREMEITLFPPTNEQGKDVTKISKSKPFNDFGSSQISKQSNLLLIRLDLFDIFMVRNDDMRDLCRPEVREESKASEAISDIKYRIVQLCMDSVQHLLASTLDSNPSSSATPANSQSKVLDDDQYTCDLQPISGNVLYCCKELMSFTSVYKRMYDIVTEMKTDDLPDAIPLTDLVATLLGNVFKTLLKKSAYFDPTNKPKQSRSINLKGHALFEAGEKDADEYLLWARKHLFLSNNLFSLHIYLQEKKRDLQAYTSSTGAGGKGTGPGSAGMESLRMLLQLADTVEKRLATEQESFCETVAGGLSFTSTEMEEYYEVYQEANKTDRHRFLKSKFSLFNSGMDALLSQQGEWRVSSSLLREILGTKLLEEIYPYYEDFYKKYSKIQFSKKHMSEYLRFPPEDVERLLQNFFGKS